MRDERDPTLDVARLVGRMMLFPVTLFVCSLEAFLQEVRRLPRAADADPAASGPGAAWPPSFDNPGPRNNAARPDPSRETVMSDTSLSDDMVKLVRFTIVSIQRDHERKIHHGEQIVTDNMSDDAFASWMIASYLQSDEYRKSGVVIQHAEKQYLRVSHEVLGRWPKQDRKYEKRQLEVLGEIRDAILEERRP